MRPDLVTLNDLVWVRVRRHAHDRGVRTATGRKSVSQVVPPGPIYIDCLRQVQTSVKNLVEDTLPNVNQSTRSFGNDLELNIICLQPCWGEDEIFVMESEGTTFAMWPLARNLSNAPRIREQRCEKDCGSIKSHSFAAPGSLQCITLHESRPPSSVWSSVKARRPAR